jgi:hypothetical protein
VSFGFHESKVGVKKDAQSGQVVYKLNTENSQSGVFRTNCIDCLDRTNLLQTIISRYVLHNYLNKSKINWDSERPLGVFDK